MRCLTYTLYQNLVPDSMIKSGAEFKTLRRAAIDALNGKLDPAVDKGRLISFIDEYCHSSISYVNGLDCTLSGSIASLLLGFINPILIPVGIGLSMTVGYPMGKYLTAIKAYESLSEILKQ